MNRDTQLETSGEIIGFYEREFYCLSNFSSFTVEWNNHVWPTVEHAYQAAKFLETEPVIAKRISDAGSAHEAQKIAQWNNSLVSAEFHEGKVALMEEICRHKLQQHEYVQKKLRQTEGRHIVEDSPKDNFWGWGSDREGENELGKIWMKLRAELPPSDMV